MLKNEQESRCGMVIILNGPSAVGKTSLQREFQELIGVVENKLWIKLGIDSLFDNPLPNITLDNINLYKNQNNIRWVKNTIDDKNNPIVSLFLGPEGRKVINGMHRAIAAYAKAGNNIIVDYILYEKEWYNHFEDELKDIPHMWVKMNINLELLEKREAARNTSPQGHARSHYYSVHDGIKYDIELDCDNKSSDELALELKNKIKNYN
jgi:chloramphenicol 3-O phosphotransferase